MKPKRIIQIVPGSGGTFYCQNCLRDEALVRQLRSMGHDVILLPMYLPQYQGDHGIQPDAPVFFGAIATYLRQKSRLFRHMPRWFERMLNARFLLDWAGRKSGSTKAQGMEDMTLSMLQGRDSRHAEELANLVTWLRQEGKPDLVHLSNALLLGLAKPIREELDVPVVCSLQDEDTWIDAMDPVAAREIWDVMAEKAADVAAFLSVSGAYGAFMQKKMRLPDDKIHVVHIGLELPDTPPATLPFNPPVIGFLSKLSPALGLDILVDAFIDIKKTSVPNVKLRAFGGMTGDDKRFVADLQRRIQRQGFEADAARFDPRYDPSAKQAFLSELSVLSVPIAHGEAFGLFQLEALALGIPVVQPNSGGFPEFIEATDGGLIYDVKEPGGLKRSLESLLLDPEKTRDLGRKGHTAVRENFTVKEMAKKTLAVYDWCLAP